MKFILRILYDKSAIFDKNNCIDTSIYKYLYGHILCYTHKIDQSHPKMMSYLNIRTKSINKIVTLNIIIMY